MSNDFQRRDFADDEDLAPAFAEWTADKLRAAIAERGAALLVVSGGKTPERYFEALSTQPLDWTRVAITLADERRVPDDSPRSNARLVREALLRNRAAVATFTPLADARLSEDPGARRRQRPRRQPAASRRRRRARHGRRRPYRVVVSRGGRAGRGDGPRRPAARRADRRRPTRPSRG